MNKREIVHFFELLNEICPETCEIFLTGAGAGSLYGNIRPTTDIDFALKLPSKGHPDSDFEARWQKISKAIEEVSARTGIAAQYAEDIDRWSSIHLLDYQGSARLFRKFDKIKLKFLDPCHWAIGKLSRYLDPDVHDLMNVFKKTKTQWEELTEVLGMALKESPKSNACFLFRKQTEDFFKTYGKKIWGSDFQPDKAIARFHKYAQIAVG